MSISRNSCLSLLLFCCIHFTAVGQSIPPKKVYKKHVATDAASGTLSSYESKASYKGLELQSFYLTMRDSVELAIDLYLPKKLAKGEKIPCLIHQTRYWRRPQLRFPFSMLSNGLLGRMGSLIKRMVNNGYAIVNVDVRGSGASFGDHQHPWSYNEIKDGAEIIDWVIQQDWSNGKVGSVGVSYGGTTAEFLASNKHPNLKAIVCMFSLFDVYDDNAFPGGIHNQWFTKSWGDANARMDANELPENYKKMGWIIKGVSPVKGEKKKLKQAIAGHADNPNVHDGAMTINHRNDFTSRGAATSVDLFSPHRFVEELNASGVAVYSYSGWHDGAYQHAAIKRYLNLSNPQNKLILGPWEHGGAYNISPFTRSMAGFDHAAELLKFFDYHLKGIDNGLYNEPKVHYFTMGAEKWQGTNVWPPVENTNLHFYLDQKQQLVTNRPEFKDTNSVIVVDNNKGTGDITRWKAVNGKVQNPYTYFDWTERSKDYCSFSSSVLTEDIEMTGHPIIHLFASMNACDGSVFVYLEDVNEQNGQVYQVTEGLLRASHRKLSDFGPYCEAVPQRSHIWEDEAVVSPNEILELQFDLLPVSYLFKKGHRIRISIAGADSDHFEIVNPQGYNLDIHFGKNFPSQLILPVKK